MSSGAALFQDDDYRPYRGGSGAIGRCSRVDDDAGAIGRGVCVDDDDLIHSPRRRSRTRSKSPRSPRTSVRTSVVPLPNDGVGETPYIPNTPKNDFSSLTGTKANLKASEQASFPTLCSALSSAMNGCWLENSARAQLGDNDVLLAAICTCLDKWSEMQQKALVGMITRTEETANIFSNRVSNGWDQLAGWKGKRSTNRTNSNNSNTRRSAGSRQIQQNLGMSMDWFPSDGDQNSEGDDSQVLGPRHSVTSEADNRENNNVDGVRFQASLKENKADSNVCSSTETIIQTPSDDETDMVGEGVKDRATRMQQKFRKQDSGLWSDRRSILRRKSIIVESGNCNFLTWTFLPRKSLSAFKSYLLESGFKQFLKDILESPQFSLFIGSLIIFNVVSVGVEAEISERHYKELQKYKLYEINVATNLFFIIEACMRITAYGKEFFVGKDAFFNWFEVVLAWLSVIDLLFEAVSSTEAQYLRVLRIFRLLRSFRLMKWLRHMREFRKMIFAMAVSAQTLFWAVVLLIFVMFLFGVWFTTRTRAFLLDESNAGNDAGNDSDLEKRFGSLSASMFSLWMSVTGGMNWFYILLPLSQVSPILSVLFVCYVAITLLGVMNIVTSVFVESAMRSTQHYRDLLMQEKKRQKETCAKHLQEIFHSIDIDGSGMINLKELKTFLSDSSLELQEYLAALELDADDARALFKLLDGDGSGEIDIQEFCDGCLRLKGEAKSFDINCLIYNSKRADGKLGQVIDGVEVMISLHMEILEKLSAINQHMSTSSFVSANTPGNMPEIQSRKGAGMLATKDSMRIHPRSK